MCFRAIKISSQLYEQNSVAFHVLLKGFVILAHIFGCIIHLSRMNLLVELNKTILKNTKKAINQSVNQSINQSIDQPINHIYR